MKMLKKAAAAAMAAMLLLFAGCGEEAPKGNIGDVELKTGDVYAVIRIMDYGEITAKLFPELAPKSVEQFTKLAQQGFYDMKTIHRVIEDYAVQGGSLSGDGMDGEIPDANYIPVEVSDQARHFYGALCFAANSKGGFSQFYIVNNNQPQDISGTIETLAGQLADESFASRLLPEDKKYYEDYLKKLRSIPQEVVEKYASVGGLYQLDGEATVFGQMIDGFDVLEKISECEVVTGNEMDDQNGIPSKPIDSIVIENVEIIHIEPEETTVSETESKRKTKETTTTTAIVAESISTTPETTPPEETTERTLDTLISLG